MVWPRLCRLPAGPLRSPWRAQSGQRRREGSRGVRRKSKRRRGRPIVAPARRRHSVREQRSRVPGLQDETQPAPRAAHKSGALLEETWSAWGVTFRGQHHQDLRNAWRSEAEDFPDRRKEAPPRGPQALAVLRVLLAVSRRGSPTPLHQRPGARRLPPRVSDPHIPGHRAPWRPGPPRSVQALVIIGVRAVRALPHPVPAQLVQMRFAGAPRSVLARPYTPAASGSPQAEEFVAEPIVTPVAPAARAAGKRPK